MTECVAFIDTDYFLHYRQLQDTDWCAFLRADSVRLQISSMVADQFDRHKDQHHNRVVRGRADNALKQLSQLFAEQTTVLVREAVTIQFLGKSPVLDYEEWSLDRHSEDDRILADIIKFRQENPDSVVVLVTGDRSFRLKAKSHDIHAIEPPDEARLPAAIDEAAEENRQLRQQLAHLQNKSPRLDLTFAGEGKHQSFTLKARLADDEQIVEAAIEKIRGEYPKIDFPVRQQHPVSTIRCHTQGPWNHESHSTTNAARG